MSLLDGYRIPLCMNIMSIEKNVVGKVRVKTSIMVPFIPRLQNVKMATTMIQGGRGDSVSRNRWVMSRPTLYSIVSIQHHSCLIWEANLITVPRHVCICLSTVTLAHYRTQADGSRSFYPNFWTDLTDCLRPSLLLTHHYCWLEMNDCISLESCFRHNTLCPKSSNIFLSSCWAKVKCAAD